MELKQLTFEEVVESEQSLVQNAEARYGTHYRNARACSIFLSRSIESVEASHHETFGRFFSLLEKYHMLALLSTVRLHKVQSMLNLRQVLEAGAAAAFAIANPEMHHFVDVDPSGFLDPSQDLARKRYKWLDEHFPADAQAIKEKRTLLTARCLTRTLSAPIRLSAWMRNGRISQRPSSISRTSTTCRSISG